MLHVSQTCPICRVGSIGFRRCSDGQTVVLMCDECEALWLRPDTLRAETYLHTRAPDWRIPGTSYSWAGGPAGWATRAEVERCGWTAWIDGESPALDEL